MFAVLLTRTAPYTYFGCWQAELQFAHTVTAARIIGPY